VDRGNRMSWRIYHWVV